METEKKFQIAAFYEFKSLEASRLDSLKNDIREVMSANAIRGTMILALEGFNATVCGTPENIRSFLQACESILDTRLDPKSSFHLECPFRKIDVKIKPEIVTLKENVDILLGAGTHVDPSEWDKLISDPEVVLLDTRNDYEFRNGTFKGAINPGTEKFSELPDFVARTLDPEKHTKVAMFCTGGIRCEKFAPYLIQQGFKEVLQLKGGILRYLEQDRSVDSRWEGECFVFDDRRTVDENLQKGIGPDYSQKSDPKDAG